MPNENKSDIELIIQYFRFIYNCETLINNAIFSWSTYEIFGLLCEVSKT